jgi:hypothetical protein
MDLTEVTKFDQQVGTLTLSQAIRIGAKLRPQCYGRLFKDGGSCALGAAYEAMFGSPPPDVWQDKFRYVVEPLNACLDRLNERFPPKLLRKVWVKNDNTESTREEIADWLESIGY